MLRGRHHDRPSSRGPALRRRAAAGVTALALLASACGSGSESEGGAATASGGSGSDATLTAAVEAVPSTLDLAVYEGAATDLAMINAYSTLIKYESIDVEDNRLPGVDDLAPSLATSWERNDDGSLTVELAEAVSPAGNEMTGEDVKWSFERAIENFSTAQFFASSFMLLDVENPVTVVDDDTVTINTTGFSVMLEPILTHWSFSILDSTEVRSHATDDDPWASAWLSTNVAGYGPYEMESFRPNAQLVLKASENFVGDAPEIERFVLQSVPESGTRLTLLNSGEADIVTKLTYEQMQSLGSDGDAVAVEGRDPGQISFMWNASGDKFSDVRVRNAISLAIDREALIEGAFSGFGGVPEGQLPSFFALPDEVASIPANLERDLDAARALLADAGYDESNPLTMELTVNPSTGPGPNANDVATLLQAQLAEAGVEATIDVVGTEAAFSEGLFGAKFDAPVFAMVAAVQDPAYLVRLLWSSDGQNRFGYQNDEVDDLSDKMLSTPLGAERDAFVVQAAEILNEELPHVPLIEPALAWGARSNLDLPAPYPLGSSFYVRDIAFK